MTDHQQVERVSYTDLKLCMILVSQGKDMFKKL